MFSRHRILKVQQLRWERGSVIPPKAGEKLSPKEVEFFGAYDRLLGDHMKKLNLDLTAVRSLNSTSGACCAFAIAMTKTHH